MGSRPRQLRTLRLQLLCQRWKRPSQFDPLGWNGWNFSQASWRSRLRKWLTRFRGTGRTASTTPRSRQSAPLRGRRRRATPASASSGSSSAAWETWSKTRTWRTTSANSVASSALSRWGFCFYRNPLSFIIGYDGAVNKSLKTKVLSQE